MTARHSSLQLISQAMIVTTMLAALAACGDQKSQTPAITVDVQL